MKKFLVTFDVFKYIDQYKTKAVKETITIEAGNKRVASLRAMAELNKNKEYEGLYKSLRSIEEVK